MFHVFARRHWPLRRVLTPELGGCATAANDAARPDFDPSDFDEAMPTIPGGYWHAKEEPWEEAMEAT